jgi:hypothetical protein
MEPFMELSDPERRFVEGKGRDLARLDVTASVTFGIGSHVLTGSDGVDRRQELLVILRRAFDETAITLAAGIGS